MDKQNTIFLGKHGSDLLAELNSERSEEDSYCDVTITVDGKQFRGHRCILSKFSKMLHKMFKTEMKEKYNSNVTLDGLNAAAMDLITDYIYTARVEITEENAFALLSASDYLQIDTLKQHCSDFFLINMDVGNVLQFRNVASLCHDTNFPGKASTLVSVNKHLFIEQPEFNDFDFDEVLGMLTSEIPVAISAQSSKQYLVTCDIIRQYCAMLVQKTQSTLNLKPRREELAFKCVVKWVYHDQNDREEYFNKLLQKVKLHDLSTKFLEEVVFEEPLVRQSGESLAYLSSELLKRLKLYFPLEVLDDVLDISSSSANSMEVKFIFANGKNLSLLDGRTVGVTKLTNKQLVTSGYFSEIDCTTSSFVACHNKLFRIHPNSNGCDVSYLRLNERKGSWKRAGQYTQNHHYYSKGQGQGQVKAVFCKGRVFIIGGHWPKSLHWFNPDAEEVEVNPTMCTHVIRENVSALAHRDCLVRAGPDNSIEFLAMDGDSWQHGAALGDREEITAAVSCGELYAFDKKGWLNWLHPITGNWQKLHCTRSHAVAAVGDGTNIYALLSSAAGYYLWRYNTKNDEHERISLEDYPELGTCYGAFSHEEAVFKLR